MIFRACLIFQGSERHTTNATMNGDKTSAQCHDSEGTQTTEVSQLNPEPRSQRGGWRGGGGGVRILKVAATPLSGWFLSIQIFGAPSPLSPIFFSELPFQVSNNFRSPPRYLHPPPLVILNELSLIHNFRSLFSPYPGRSVPGPSSSARNNFYRPPPPKKPKKTDFFSVERNLDAWLLSCSVKTSYHCASRCR